MGAEDSKDLTTQVREVISCEGISRVYSTREHYQAHKADAVRDFLEGKYRESRELLETALAEAETLEERLTILDFAIKCSHKIRSQAAPEAKVKEFRRISGYYQEMIGLQETADNYLAYMNFLGRISPNEGAYLVKDAISVGKTALSIFPEDGRLHASMYAFQCLEKQYDEAYTSMVKACQLKYDDPDFLIQHFGQKIWLPDFGDGKERGIAFFAMINLRQEELMINAPALHRYAEYMMENVPMSEPTVIRLLDKAYDIQPNLKGLNATIAEAYDKGLQFLRKNPDYNQLMIIQLRKFKVIRKDFGLIPKELALHSPKKGGKKEIIVPPPRVIKAHLDEYIIGQEHIKKTMAQGIFRHALRLKASEDGDTRMKKSNIFVIGPTGCGKTYVASVTAIVLARALNMDIPFIVFDSTPLTGAGYHGANVEDIVRDLYFAAEKDIEKTQRGVIYLDEIDKKKRNPSTSTADVGGQAVQHQLLRPLEGTVMSIPITTHKLIQVDTNHILFIAGGSFSQGSATGSLSELMEEEDGGKTVGFRQMESGLAQSKKHRMALKGALEKYGFAPEFLNRFPIKLELKKFTQEELRTILTEPKDAIMQTYEVLFEHAKIKLKMEDAALDAIAEHAMSQDEGARGLSTICEIVFDKALYELPGSGEKELVVDRDFVLERLENQNK
ncbi:MAG: AAA family ATPase [Nanoarchaeota archaeon]|nr:AAA family ATPase [Nanoarchaeota archaeon]